MPAARQSSISEAVGATLDRHARMLSSSWFGKLFSSMTGCDETVSEPRGTRGRSGWKGMGGSVMGLWQGFASSADLAEHVGIHA